MPEFWSNVPGGSTTIVGLSTSAAVILVLAFTQKAWLALIAGFGVCWGLTLTGIVPIWTAILCTLAVGFGVAAWRLWLRD